MHKSQIRDGLRDVLPGHVVCRLQFNNQFSVNEEIDLAESDQLVAITHFDAVFAFESNAPGVELQRKRVGVYIFRKSSPERLMHGDAGTNYLP